MIYILVKHYALHYLLDQIVADEIYVWIVFGFIICFLLHNSILHTYLCAEVFVQKYSLKFIFYVFVASPHS